MDHSNSTHSLISTSLDHSLSTASPPLLNTQYVSHFKPFSSYSTNTNVVPSVTCTQIPLAAPSPIQNEISVGAHIDLLARDVSSTNAVHTCSDRQPAHTYSISLPSNTTTRVHIGCKRVPSTTRV